MSYHLESTANEESVLDYPETPYVEPASAHIRVVFNGIAVADTHHARRVLQCEHPPCYYIPPGDIDWTHLERSNRVTVCKWKGQAHYFDAVVGQRRARHAAWCYATPKPGFTPIRDHLGFYPHKVDACLVDGERARPESDRFYGGWITDGITGSSA